MMFQHSSTIPGLQVHETAETDELAENAQLTSMFRQPLLKELADADLAKKRFFSMNFYCFMDDFSLALISS